MKNKYNEKIEFKYNLAVFWNFLKKYKFLFITLLISIMITEALFVIDKYLFKIVIDQGTEFVAGNLAQQVFLHTIILVAVVFLIIVFVRTFGKWLNVHLLILLDTKMTYDLKKKFFNHIVGLDHGFHTTHKTGSLISRLGRGARAVENMVDVMAFNLAPLIFQLAIVSFSLVFFGWKSAIALIITTIIFVSYSFYIQQIQQKSKLEYNKAEDIEKGNVSDIFTNIDSIKYFGKEKYIANRFDKLTRKTQYASFKEGSYYRWFDAGQILILGLGTFFLLYFPLMDFLAGKITLGTLVFVYTIYGNVIGPMFGFVWGMRGFYRAMADFQDLFQYGKSTNAIKDKPNAKNLKIENGSVEFKNVSFSYHKNKVLDNVNISIKPGEKVALVGHSGSGKTTLVKMLYRFYDINQGQILIDNKNIADVNQESLRGELSIVPQEAILFDDTIYNNVAFSNPKASKEEVIDAMKFAQLISFVKNLPKKEKTIVGERGVKLSGGEKQRVSIARAILANKKVLVLDEATSALDSKTEYEIQKDLQKLMQGRTSIIIAHRLSTIMNADKIVVMDKGKVAQVGRHLDLISQKGVYRELWNLQKGGYLEE